MIREILKMGDERLLRIAPPVPPEMFDSPELWQLIDDMFQTMEHVGGVGLAAPQIGVDLQLVIFGFESSERYPEAPAGTADDFDQSTDHAAQSGSWKRASKAACPVPGLRGAVDRYQQIRYEGFDPKGEPIVRIADGFHARVVQHECDHLIGRLYPSRISDFSKFGFIEVMFPDMDPTADE